MASTEIKNRFKIGFYILSFAISMIAGLFIMNELNQIHHRLDVRDAYFNKGLIDGAKVREAGYFDERKRNREILDYCEENDCNLPTHLRRELPAKNFTPIETVLMNK